MTTDLGNGPMTFEFASPEARQGVKRVCDILSYTISEAGRLAGNLEYDMTGEPITFEEFMQKVERNGGKMTGMYSYERNPDSNQSMGMVTPVSGEVDLNKCSIVMHEPISDKSKSPFPGGVGFSGYWMKYDVNEKDGVVIHFAPMLKRAFMNVPFVSEKKSTTDNAKAMSEILALFVDDMERLLDTKFSQEIVLDGDEKAGSKRRIELSRRAKLGYDMEEFFTENPDAGTKWLKLAK